MTVSLADRDGHAAGASAVTAPASDDSIRVAGSRWRLWSCAGLRGAGFPADRVLALASPRLAQEAIRLLRLRAGRTLGRSTPASRAPIGPARDALRQLFAAETRRLRGALYAAAADPAFREAVVWQNRRAFKRAIEPLIAAAPGEANTNSGSRQRDLLVASYLQRYCVKNDTIGFFGPVGWVRLDDRAPAITVEPGPRLLAARRLYFESWCVDAIAHLLDADPELRPWRVPRLLPAYRIEGTRLTLGGRTARELRPDHARLLAACDGDLCAKQLAAALCRSTTAAAGIGDADVYDLLDDWQRAGYISWTFEGPRELHAERTLRRRVEQIDVPALRDRALAPCDALEAAARAVGDAAGDADALDRAMQALESTFTRVTGAAPTRLDGRMYAARTLVYEDCRRDVSAVIGGEVQRRLGPPLSLMLKSARWAFHELARRHDAEFRRTFDALSAHGTRPVGLGAFMSRTGLNGGARGTQSDAALDVRTALQQRWTSILAPPAAARRIQYRSRDLREAVDAAFATSGPAPSAWARHVSPDVMIDAPGVEAIQRGDYQLVLGELHLANTLAQSVFVTQQPDDLPVTRALARDCPTPRVIWIYPKEFSAQRVHVTATPCDFAYAATREPLPVPSSRALRIADLMIVEHDGALVVQSRGGGVRFPCLEFFGGLLMRQEIEVFGLLAPSAHAPRLTIDDVVVQRERWQVPASALTFAATKDDLHRFVACLRWAHLQGLPRFVFVRLPIETKPIYVDLWSPIYVDLFVKYVRNLQRAAAAAVLTITEMLPAPDGAWLTDADGQRYTCELRFVAADPSVSEQ